MPACFLGPLLQLLLLGLRKQLSNCPNQFGTIHTFFPEFGQIKGVSRETVFHRPLSWLVHIDVSANLWYKCKNTIRHRCQKGFNTVRDCSCAMLLEEKSSIQSLVGSWHRIIRRYTFIMLLVISRQKLSITPYLHNLEAVTSKAVCHRDLEIFSCFIQERLCGELACRTAPSAEVKDMPRWKPKSPVLMREHKAITQYIP